LADLGVGKLKKKIIENIFFEKNNKKEK